MAKVIRHGTYPEENKVTCEECKCIFQYYNSEVDVDMTSPDEQSFFGGFGVTKTIKCPECKHTIVLASTFIEDKDLLDLSFIPNLIDKARMIFSKKKGDHDGSKPDKEKKSE